METVYKIGKQCIYNVLPAVYNKMQKWEKDIIFRTLKRCNGLRYAITSTKEDVVLEAVKSLAYQSGMRIEFIKNHLEEIKTL